MTSFLRILGWEALTRIGFISPTNPLNDPFIPMGEIFEPNMPLVSLQDLLQNTQFPSPQSSESKPSEYSSDSSHSFTFATTPLNLNPLSYLSKSFILNHQGQVIKMKGPLGPRTHAEFFEKNQAHFHSFNLAPSTNPNINSLDGHLTRDGASSSKSNTSPNEPITQFLPQPKGPTD